jgi:hypothetical protein
LEITGKIYQNLCLKINNNIFFFYTHILKRYDDIAKEASIKALGQMRAGKKRVLEVPAEQHATLK